MTHPLFHKEIFLETAFEKRFQAMLRSAWHKRSWHVNVADPGSGKTMGIRDLVKTAGSRAILAIVTPKNNEDEQALGDQLYTALGLPLRGHWRTRKPKLMGHLHRYGTECIIVDDAHEEQAGQKTEERASSNDGYSAVTQPTKSVKCTFSGVVPIDLQQFLDSGVSLVECPDCTSTSSLSPHKGVLRFASHKRRKTRSTSTESRWAKREMIWAVVNE